ncbi:Uncharacterised protein [Paenibacillus thiaminolyticus]|nr:Uncharacterised protein [Paenibacillus thiaminolyticus]
MKQFIKKMYTRYSLYAITILTITAVSGNDQGGIFPW